MEKATITLSFDDGRKDTYYVFMNILKNRGIPATVNIPSGYIEIGYSDPVEVGYNGLMSKEELDEIANEPLFEIAGHGFLHKNEEEDIRMGIDKLREWFPHINYYGFASPHSAMKDSEVIKRKDFYERVGIKYVRLGRNFWHYNYFRRGLSKIASTTGNNKSFVACYNKSLNNVDSFVLHAIPVIRTTTLDQIKAIVDLSIKEKKWCILEIHGIDKKNSKEYQDLFCWDRESFINLCDYLIKLQTAGLISLKNTMEVIEKEYYG